MSLVCNLTKTAQTNKAVNLFGSNIINKVIKINASAVWWYDENAHTEKPKYMHCNVIVFTSNHFQLSSFDGLFIKWILIITCVFFFLLLWLNFFFLSLCSCSCCSVFFYAIHFDSRRCYDYTYAYVYLLFFDSFRYIILAWWRNLKNCSLCLWIANHMCHYKFYIFLLPHIHILISWNGNFQRQRD